MKDPFRTKPELIKENSFLKQSIKELEQAETERKRMEVALRQSEEKYRSIFENAVEGIFQTTPEGQFISVNPSYVKMFGYSSQEELITGTINVGTHIYANPDDRTGFKRLMDELGVVQGLEFQALKKDRTRIWISLNARAVKDAMGTILYYEGTMEDITLLKQAELAARESEERYHRLFDLESDAIFLIDNETGSIIEANNAASSLYGYSKEELLEKKNTDLSAEPEHTREATHKEMNMIPLRYHRKKNGTVFPVEITATHLMWNGRRSHLAAIRDIAQRKKSEEELERQRMHLRLVIDTVPNYIFAKDIDGRFLLANKAVADVFGVNTEDVVGKTDLDYGASEEQKTFYNMADRAVIESGKPLFIPEEQIMRKDGTLGWFQTSKIPYQHLNGDKPAILGVSVDITERKQAEEALKESENQLQEIFDTLQVGIILVNLSGIITFANKRMSEMFRQPLPELIGSSYPSHLHPDERAIGLTLMQKLIAGEIDSISTFERHYIRPDGSDFWGYLNGRRLTDAKGNLISIVGTIADITEHKMAEEKLKQQANAMKASMDGIAILNEHQKYVYANESHARIYGYDTSEELIGQSWHALYDEDELQRFNHAIIPEFIQKRQWQGEATGKKKDGSSFPQEVSLTALDNGGLICVARDITERKKMEDALKKSEEKYRNIFENALEGIFQTTPEGRVLGVNPALARICGYESPREIMDVITDIGTELYVHPEDRIRLKELFQEHGVAERFEAQFYKKDGSKVWVSMNARTVTDTGGNIVFYEGILEDITARKQAEEDLHTTHQRLFDVIEFLPDATFVIDEKKKVVAWNRACEEMTGVKKDEIIGKDDHVYAIPFYGERRPILIDHVTIGSNELQQGYTSIKRKGHQLYAESFTPMLNNGKGAFLSGKASPLFDGAGKVVGAIESLRDITEFKNLETQLSQAQKMESIGTLAGGIAHDFNNILTSLMGYTALIQMKMDTSDPLRPYVDEVLMASEKAADLTKSLLTFSRQQSVTLAPLDINNTIKAAKKLLKRLLTEDIELRTSLTHDDTVVMADRSQMDQILFNLVTNARDAMPKGGTLILGTDIADMDNRFIETHGFGEPGRYVLINISDTGEGMDEATRQKIFDPFFTTKEIGKGTGLGLATVYGIVRQHDGYITVESTLNRGTTFHVYLPAIKMKVDETEDAAIPIKRGKETILIAEDNVGVRHFMREALQGHGYIIKEATDGEDAVKKFEENRNIDLIIIDSVMPKKNGRETYEEIHGIDPHIKVLFTSGYTKDVVLDKGIEEKEFDFIAKPLSLNKLLQKVREVLDR